MGRRNVRSYVRDFLANWRDSEDDFGTKLWLTARHRAIAAGHFLSGKGWCCGHHGEPGC
jgi:hypothetical protein